MEYEEDEKDEDRVCTFLGVRFIQAFAFSLPRTHTHAGQVHVVLVLATLDQPVAQLAVVQPFVVNPLDSG